MGVRFIFRLGLCLLPIVYAVFIWEQSSHFNPESVYQFSNVVSMNVLKLLGISFELAHLFEFGFLYLFIVLACLSFSRLNRFVELSALIIALLYGVVDEIHQNYVPYRSTSVIDLVKDFIGVFALWWFVHRIYFVKKDSRIGSFLRKVTNVKKDTSL